MESVKIVGPFSHEPNTLEDEMLAQLATPEADQERKVIPFSKSDDAILRGLVAGESWAADALYDQYAPAIERILRRTLGHERHAELEDLLHEVFLQAITSAEKLRDSVALLAWLQTIAVRTAFRQIRRRRARSWLWFHEPERMPEVVSEDAPPEVRQACASLYGVLDRMPAAEQLVFSLRYVQGMKVEQLAAVCEVSLSTAKRRLRKADERFAKLAMRDPVLKSWVGEGAKWTP